MALPFLFGGQSNAGDGDDGVARRGQLSIVPLSLDTTPIEVLVERLRAGDHAAFRAVWDAYHVRLADFAYRYLRSEDAAADVVQQVFVALWEGRETVRFRTTVINYLYSAVRNRVGNFAQHERIVRRYASRVAASHSAGGAVSPERADALVETAEIEASIARALQALPPRTREIFLLSREDGLSPADIAVLLGIGVQVVYNQLARALKRLSEAFPQE